MSFTIMKKKMPHRKELIYSTVFILLFCIVFAMYKKWEQTGSPFVPETVLVFFIMLLMSTLTVMLAFRIFSYIEKKALPKYVIPALILFYIGAYISSYISITTCLFFWFILKGRSLNEFFPQLFKNELSGVDSSLMAGLVVITVMFFYLLWIKAMGREQKLKEEKLVFQYETLKNQVNPHFLFNSLNTLSSLVTASKESADLFINKLASIYRYILENSSMDTVPLESEISFVKDYFFLHKIRDEEKISLDIKLNDCNDCKILPISLQMLIENALKHNIATRENPLNIKIFSEESYIVVENNLQKMTNLSASSKTGLKNLGERIRLMTGKDLIIEETQNNFIVKLPLIT